MALLNAAIPPLTQTDYQAMILAAMQHQLSLGITSTSDCGVNQGLLAAYRALDAAAALPSRVNVMPLYDLGADLPLSQLPPRTSTPRLRIDTVKLLADGGLSGATAALSVSYRHADTRGVLRFDPPHLRDLMTTVHNHGWRIANPHEWTPQATEAPFGGWKESGLGRESDAEGLDEYLETKLVAIGGI